MPNASEVQNIIDYYVNLLVIQYNNQPKAKATIDLFVNTMLADGIYLDVLNAYNIDTAVGKQLDTIAKYIGVDRFYEVFDLVDFFAVTTYSEVSPDALAKWGFSDYTTFDGDNYNGTLNYSSIISESNSLPDADFRILLRLKILQNTENHSVKAINDAMFKYFGDDVIPTETGNMEMTYTVTNTASAIIKAAIYKKVLPRPMGVQLNLVEV